MNNINNESNNILSPQFSSYKPPLYFENLLSFQSQAMPQNIRPEQIRAIAFLALEELSKHYTKNPWQNPFKGKDKEIYPQFVTNSHGKIVCLATTLKKECRADVNKVEKYVKSLLNTDSSVTQDEKNKILNQLQIFQQLWKKALKEKKLNANAVANKLIDLKLNINDGKSETLQTIDGDSYRCIKFNTSKKKFRQVRLYKDADDFPIALVYLSSKGTNCNTNGKVSQLGGKKIVCKHMAVYQMRHRDDPNWRKVLNNLEKMKQDPELNDCVIDIGDFVRQGDRIYMCSPFNIGEALYKLSIDSKNLRPTALFSTRNHVMAVSIEKRKKGGVLLKFYDPNHSDDIVRIIVPSVNQLKKLTIDCLLDKKEFKAYFPEDSIENTLQKPNKFEYLINFFSNKPTHELCAFFTSYNDPMKPTGNWENTEVETLVPKIISNDPELNRKWLMENLRMSMFMNQNNVSKVIKTILTSKTLSKDDKILCMKASTPKTKRTYPVISESLLFGSTEALKVYMQEVFNYPNFSDEERYELLGGLKNGNSFLYFGFKSDHKNCEEAVMAYVKAVVAATNLPSHYKVNLLRAQIDQSFGLALDKNNKLRHNFIKFIMKCNLNEEEKDRILLGIFKKSS